MQGIVYTLSAACRDCYRCLRKCPVKAISMKNGQAFVEQDRCISCGTCVRECPQGAKTYQKDISKLEEYINNAKEFAVTVAPSFIARYKEDFFGKVVALLRRYAVYVAETTIGASFVTDKILNNKTIDTFLDSQIGSACPAVVNYIKRYRPDMLAAVSNTVSPMVAHARYIKSRFKDAKIVFIGPCIAKKDEASWPETNGIIDAVLTFDELEEWISANREEIDKLNPVSFDEYSTGVCGLYPLEGGMIDSAANTAIKKVHISGEELIAEYLGNIDCCETPEFCEALFCREGCINGPGVKWDTNIFVRKSAVNKYVKSIAGSDNISDIKSPDDLSVIYSNDKTFNRKIYTEEEITGVLALTGKSDQADQLNCQACGYESCRDNAIAVLDGVAELEMCIPYMRKKAEKRADRIMETSPNGIILLDKNLQIVKMNNAFKEFFLCTDALIGKRVSYLFDPGNFEMVLSGENDMVDVVTQYKQYGLVCHEIVYAMRDDELLAGIFVNITNLQKNEKQLEIIKKQTIKQARDLLEHQIGMAQELAAFLGESTAKGEEIIGKLISLDGDGDE